MAVLRGDIGINYSSYIAHMQVKTLLQRLNSEKFSNFCFVFASKMITMQTITAERYPQLVIMSKRWQYIEASYCSEQYVLGTSNQAETDMFQV
jgi:hypothetical protein